MTSPAPSASVTQCLECNAPLSPAETQGLCARCLLKMGLASQFGENSVGDAGRRKLVPPPLFPFDFGAYRVLRLLGRGGMGAVYEAEDSASGRRVALKVLGHSLDSADTRKRFLREGRLAASINHPNSVYVYGTEEIDDTPVITMELVPGGTLQERVKAGGPLPIGEAVDVILQVMAGLEAAHTAGILHRDIKPSNCFLEPGGTVKIGDFGLSISTLARGDSALTMAGSILGTPDFSSPEQLRGEALDIRADIYSVGVTLYYLLTGRAPFQAENMVALLANVLDKPAPSPRSFRPEIPEALARVILRCLAKPAGDRYANYDELRRALLPFTSTAPTPATLGLRFVAGVIDHLVFTTVNLIIPVLLFGGLQAVTDPKMMRSAGWIWFSICALAFEIAYLAVGEGRWGATPGKALVGLRVGDLQRNAPGIPRALLRSLIYLLPTIASFLRYQNPANSPQSVAWNYTISIAFFAYPALLALTARRHNGFATVIDLLTGTRVIQRAAYEARETVSHSDEPVATSDTMPKVGPYHALAALAEDAEGELLLGYDTKLTRRVWLRKTPAGAAPVTAELRQTARPSRLRWLQGHRENGAAWDAYEAAPGVPLTRLLNEPQPWKKVRHWLLDLAEEFAAAQADGSMPAQLSLDRIWITDSGGAKLLDFRAPGAEGTVEPLAPTEAAVFLNQLAISALEGRVATPEEARTSAPRASVPLRARSLLHGLRAAHDLGAVAVELKALLQQRPAISRRRRLGLVVGCVIPSLLVAGFFLLGMKMFATWQQAVPDIMPLKTALINHERLEQGKHVAPQLDPLTRKPALETYIAGRYGPLINDTAALSSPYALGVLPAADRRRAAGIVARVGQPSEQAMAEARAALGSAIDEHGELDLAPRYPKPGEGTEPMFYGMAFGGFVWAAILSVACAVLFRGGVLMRALGIAVVRGDGSDASRLRMLWRACVAWSTFPLAGLLLAMLIPVLPPFTAAALAAVVVIALTIWSAARRGRSLQDCLAGTFLVPR
jgi:uncharacterized RDD family membrane protein YckC